MSRTRRSTWNYLAGIAFTVVSLSAGLMATPLLVRWLGDERLGAYRAATDWFGYLSLLELGLGGSLLPLFARAVARAKPSEVSVVLAAGIQAYLGVVMLMLVAGASLVGAVLYLVPVSPVVTNDLRAGCLVSLLGLVVVPLTPFRLLAEASQRDYVVHCLLAFQTLFIVAVGLLLAWSGWGITGQSLAMLAGALPFHFVLAWDGIRRYPEALAFLIPLTQPSPPANGGEGRVRGRSRSFAKTRRELWKLNCPTFIFDTCGRVSLLTDNVVIACLLGPTIVVPFFLTQRLAALAQGQLQGIGNASWAALVDLHVAGDRDGFNHRLIELTSAAAAVGVAAMVPIAAYNEHFVRWWVGGGYFAGEWVTIVAAINGFLQAIFSLWGWVFSGTGQISRLVRMYVTAAVINLTVSIVCTQLFGLVGPLLGTLAAFATVNLWWLPWLLQRVFGTSLPCLFGAMAMPLAIGLPYAALIWWFAHMHVPGGWFGLAWEMTLAGLFYLALWWWLALRSSDRNLWRTRLRVGLGWKAA